MFVILIVERLTFMKAAPVGIYITMGIFLWDNNFCCFLCVFHSRCSTSLYETWTETVSESSQYNLNLPLISRDPDTKLISVNFSPQVFTLIHFAQKTDPREAARGATVFKALKNCGHIFH